MRKDVNMLQLRHATITLCMRSQLGAEDWRYD